MAKSKDAVEYVWLQCTECNELNYRTPINVKGGMPEKMKAGPEKILPPRACPQASQDQAGSNPAASY